MENILLNPNVAYLIIVGAGLLTMLAILSPGTGLLEVAALFALALAGYTIYMIPINWWALAILILGVFPFLLAVRKSKNYIYLAISIAALVIGSIFLFDTPGWMPAVNPFLALIVSTLVAVFTWVVAHKVLETEKIRPAHDLKALIGAIGEAKTEIHTEGSVQVSGELWSAQSDQEIPIGAKIRVVNRDGFILKVEQVDS